MRGYLNGQALDLAYDAHGPSAWSADLALPPGTNALTVYADHPSGLFTTNTASTFTVPTGAFDQEVSQYDGAGNVTNRTWKNSLKEIAPHRLCRFLIDPGSPDGSRIRCSRFPARMRASMARRCLDPSNLHSPLSYQFCQSTRSGTKY
ncbi:hypothetical protein [Pedosphaera parvula]|uniref:hypothetical protein n=1 Tax=Pedosphaera parvula TaxID=1032527 RepID=UPI00058CE318|nr:hypothetical protein [Pedosphaera parvula]